MTIRASDPALPSITFAGALDFFRLRDDTGLLLQPEEIPRYLRFLYLFTPGFLLTDKCLLHHPGLCALSRSNIDELQSFMDFCRPVVPRSSADDLRTFELHWHASQRTDNPFLVSKDHGGLKYAIALDTLTANCIRPDYSDRRGFADYHAAFERIVVPAIGQNAFDTLSEVTTLQIIESPGYRERVKRGEQDPDPSKTRLSRAAIRRTLDARLGGSLLTNEPNRQAIMTAACVAYARDVLQGLEWPSAGARARVVTTHLDMGSRPVQLREFADLYDTIVKHGEPTFFDIGWDRLLTQSWEELHGVFDCVKLKQRPSGILKPSQVRGWEFFDARRALLGSPDSPQQLEEYFDAFDAYLEALQKDYPARANSPRTVTYMTRHRRMVVQLLVVLTGGFVDPWMGVALSLGSFGNDLLHNTIDRNRAETDRLFRRARTRSVLTDLDLSEPGASV